MGCGILVIYSTINNKYRLQREYNSCPAQNSYAMYYVNPTNATKNETVCISLHRIATEQHGQNIIHQHFPGSRWTQG